MRRFRHKLWAVIRGDTLSAIRYRGVFWTSVLGLFAEIAGIYFLARAVGSGFRPDGVSYFSFLLVGTSFYTFLWLGINSFIESIKSAQLTGTLEVLMTTSTSGPEVVLLMAVSSFVGRIFSLILSLVVGFVVFGAQLRSPNLAVFAFVLVLSLLLATAFGMVAAAVQILIQKGSAVVWLFGSLTWLLGGTMFPVSALPRPLLMLARMIPFTQALDAMRASLLRGETLAQLFPAVSVLTLWTLVLVPTSILLFSLALRRAMTSGTLACY